MAAAAHFLIRKKLFNSKYPQLLVAKDFAVAEKKLHLAVSGRKYDPGKKAPKKRHTSDVKTADPKPSTSQAQPQGESISESEQLQWEKIAKVVNQAKLAIRSDSEELQWEKIGKVVNQVKLAILSNSDPHWWEKIGKVENWAKLAIPSDSELLW